MAQHVMQYGDKTWSLEVADENLVAELESRTAERSALSEAEIVRQALASPVGSAPLHELVRRGDKVCVLVPDVTRLWQSPAVYAPEVVRALNEAGIPDDDITILSATGTHRSQTREEHVRLLGEDLVRRVKIVDHDCRDTPNMVRVGTTSRGTPVLFNRCAVEADKIVSCCGVVHHFLAGFGGGGKMLLPGIAAYETVQHHHNFALNEGFGSGTNPDVRSANLEDSNIFHADIVEAASMLAPCFSLNVVTGDHGIIAAFAGDWQKAHLEACRMIDALNAVDIPSRAPLVIASAGGYPKDINLYQTIKLLSNALAAVEPGGTMILLSRCGEGFGSEDVERQLTAYASMEEREKALRSTFSIGSYVGFLFAEAAEKQTFILVTDMDAACFARTGIIAVKTLDEALAVARQRNGGSLSMKTILMPHGATTLPRLPR